MRWSFVVLLVACGDGSVTVDQCGNPIDDDARMADVALPAPPPPATPCLADDSYEPNDVLFESRPFSMDSDLVVCPDSPDYYSISVPDGATVDATVIPDVFDDSVTIALLDPCGNALSGDPPTATGNQELIAGLFERWTNDRGLTVNVHLAVASSVGEQLYSADLVVSQ